MTKKGYIMTDIIVEAVLDALKAFPFLFIAYLLIEYIEHNMKKIPLEKLLKRKKTSVCAGALLGVIPQCGFSVTASNFYAAGLISGGTLLAVFLATSDEAVPVLMARPELWPIMGCILVLKVIIAICGGFLLDSLWKNKEKKPKFETVCDHCHCESSKNIIKPAFLHTLKMFGFILVLNLLLGVLLEYCSDALLQALFLHGSVFQPFVAALFGLIPNCAPSVALTQLYIQQQISFGALVAGLCSGAGMGMAVLFRMNKDKKENIQILAALYGIAVLAGMLINGIV